MEKRVLLAIFLSFLVLYVYQAFLLKRAPDGLRGRPAAASPSVPSGAGEAAQPSAGLQPAVPASELKVSAEPTVKAIVGEQAERDIVVDTAVVRAIFTNRGAELKSWTLKRYFAEKVLPPAPAQEGLPALLGYIGRQFREKAKEPQELIPMGLPAGHPRPFRLRTDDSAVTERLGTALFSATDVATAPVIDGTKSGVSVAFAFQDESGLVARKTFRFEPESYVVRFSASVSTGGKDLNPTVLWGPALGDLANSASSNRYLQKSEAIFFRDGSVTRVAAAKLASQPVPASAFRYVGVDDHYFIAVALPQKTTRVDYEAVTIPPAGPESATPRELVAFGAHFSEAPQEVRFFFGPKDFDELAAVDRELVRVINYGMFSVLAVPLLRALKGINAYVGNYGWSIIILTALINLLMFPLRHKSVVSMRRMQEIQPEIKALQDRYGKLKATDPARQKMNQEMMSLYKEKGVNPASGCLPMLLTLPVLFAFYSLLSQAIEIRGAPFALWIKDLSVHDMLYVTPILMGATMVWQQKITPSSADPMQQKMMMAMPLVFTFMFLWAPSGLVIYWFVSNVLAISQQYITNRIVGPPKVARPPAERRLKRAGAGQTEGAARNGS